MQWLEKVIKFFSLFFRSSAFKMKYKTKKSSQLKKIILNDKKWQVIDIRNSISYQEHHLDGTINIPNTDFSKKYFKLINNKKNVLIINGNYRSNLDVYTVLKKHNFKTWILMENYENLRNNELFENLTRISIY